MVNALCCDLYSDEILRSKFLYNLYASENLKLQFMLGKCFVLFSSISPSGTYLGKCKKLQAFCTCLQKEQLSVLVLCSLFSNSQEFNFSLHQFVLYLCLIQVQLHYTQILEISVEILSSALTALVENTSVDCL